jgi:hypothetical protein
MVIASGNVIAERLAFDGPADLEGSTLCRYHRDIMPSSAGGEQQFCRRYGTAQTGAG